MSTLSVPGSMHAGAIIAVLLVGAIPAAAQESWRTDFTRHTVPLDEITSGGPPKDGIPAIDHPRFVSVRQADRWLGDREPVAVVRIGTTARIYPLQVLIWHEIVNDEVGGIPVSVTFCPLCNTTLAFDRRFDGKVLDFGTTGRLRNSDLVMYDRQTESWWQQATGEGIVGQYAGRKLTFIPAPVMNWKAAQAAVPDAQVLSRETGFSRPYGRNPYAGYDTRSGPRRAFFRGRTDPRLPAMERVVTVDPGSDPVAVPFSDLQKEHVIAFEAGGRRFVVFWAPGTASALDRSSIADGRDVGSSAVFQPEVEGRHLTFTAADDDRFTDRETGSTWNLLGDAVAGPLAGKHLRAVPHGNHFWFAWGVFRPDTRIVRH